MTIHTWFAMLAGSAAALSYVFYIVAMVRGQLKPQRATWLIWSAVAILLLRGLIASGEREMIWVPWAYACGSSFIFLLSLRYGVGGWSKLDIACISGAALSLIVWKILGSPTVPVLINLFVDLLGFLPTFKKSWEDPKSERNIGWVLFTLGNLLNFGSVTTWNPLGTLYMVYMFVGCGLVTLLTYRPIPDTAK